MRFVAPPTHVGIDGWPVLSAVRVATADTANQVPAEFVVLADCGEGTPREPYATFRVFVWPDHSKTTDGEYDLTFAQAQRSLTERAGLLPTATVEVVVVRDPDRANDYTVFIDGAHQPAGRTGTVRVVCHDIDLGAVEITAAWVDDQLQRTRVLSPAAAGLARDAVLAYADDLPADRLHAEAPECGDGGDPEAAP
jgi:hypothetical protein